ncbi:MAG: type I phosphomannose isomerase catalytic subunit [Bacteroidales bacterium]|jgi:mannose-6-phosphate isomerase
MSVLYPLKFEPLLKEKIWGGSSLVSNYKKSGNPDLKYGESWELSAVSDNLSIIENGFLAGNNIEELIEVYMGDLVGDTVYEKFGIEFPLLIKLIESESDLSLQVHPNNELALKRHNAYGKTEMWYIMEAKNNARIYTGFKKETSREEYLNAVKNKDVASLIRIENCSPGDVFLNPSGRIHAIGAGLVLVEIQQTSDITYRISDWGRLDDSGKPRELHTDLATDAIDFNSVGSLKSSTVININSSANIAECEFFNTNLQWIDRAVMKNYESIDSFIVYICVEGSFNVRWNKNSEEISLGETVLIPATLRELVLEPTPEAKLLEIYIKNRK